MHNKIEKILRTTSVLSVFFLLSSTLDAASFTVENENSAGIGSLKEAIISSNAITPSPKWGNELLFSSDLVFSNTYPAIRNNLSLKVLDNTTIDFLEPLNGTALFEKSGPGTLRVSAPFNFLGDWTIREGTLRLHSLSPIQGDYRLYGTLSFDNAAVLGDHSIYLYTGSILQPESSSLLSNRLEVLGDAIIDTGDRDLTLAYVAQEGSVTKIGRGRLTMINPSYFKGEITINQGTLVLNKFSPGGMINLNQASLEIASEAEIQNYQLKLRAARVDLIRKQVRFDRPVTLAHEVSVVNLLGHGLSLNGGTEGTGDLFFMGPGDVTLRGAANSTGLLAFDKTHLFISEFAKNTRYQFQDASLDLQNDASLDDSSQWEIDEALDYRPNGYRLAISGAIYGTGTLSAKNPGSTVWQSRAPFLGRWIQESGDFEAHGYLANLELYQEAVLKGTILGKNLTVLGKLETLDITMEDQVILGSTAVIHNQINPENSQKSIKADFIHVDGVLKLVPEKGHYEPMTMTVAEAHTQVDGDFQALLAPAQFSGHIIREPTKISYQLDKFYALEEFINRNRFDDVALARSLDQMLAAPGSDMDGIIHELLTYKESELSLLGALDGLQPAYFSALGLVQESNFILDRSSLSNRMQELLSFPCAESYVRDQNWNLWFDPVGDFTRQKSRQQDMGYWGRTFGFFSGFDGKVTDTIRLGLSAGYTHSRVEWKENVGRGFINSGYLSGYFLYNNPHNFYLNGSLTGGYNHYTADRFIHVGSIDRTSHHKNHGFGFSSDLEIGYLIHRYGTFQPFIRQSYIGLYQQSFTETGAQSLDLSVKSKDFAMYRIESGLLYNYCFDYPTIAFNPEVTLTGIYELELKTGNFHATYVDSGESYEVVGMKPRRFLISPGFAFDMVFKNIFLMLGVRYHAELGTQFYDQRVSGHVGYSF